VAGDGLPRPFRGFFSLENISPFRQPILVATRPLTLPFGAEIFNLFCLFETGAWLYNLRRLSEFNSWFRSLAVSFFLISSNYFSIILNQALSQIAPSSFASARLFFRGNESSFQPKLSGLFPVLTD